ncbi:hypothetical protein MHU86_11890 [Fragilaria crotonensis]|nr:hypothetical protein MHU86_11890 [Fragilaria crotonensis]
MVVKGPFHLALVRADSREVFKEHVNENGEIYAEVEPDMEYFIRVKSTFKSMVRADFFLDGSSLGYCTNLIPGREELHGTWEIEGNKQINKALCFCIQDSGVDSGVHKQWIGSIEVKFSEAIPMSIYKTRDAKSRWIVGVIDGSISQTMRKVVKSKEGTLSLVSDNPRRKRRYRAGKELTSIRINYCTAFGLIHAGLLPKPPLWDFHRSRYPRELFLSPEKMTPSMIRCLNVMPKPVTLRAACPDLGVQEVVVDFFDLVEADDSDDDEGILRRKQVVNRKLSFDPETHPFKNGMTHSDNPASGSTEAVLPMEKDDVVFPSTIDTKTDFPVASKHPEETLPNKRLRGESKESSGDIQIEATSLR